MTYDLGTAILDFCILLPGIVAVAFLGIMGCFSLVVGGWRLVKGLLGSRVRPDA